MVHPRSQADGYYDNGCPILTDETMRGVPCPVEQLKRDLAGLSDGGDAPATKVLMPRNAD